MRQWPFVLRGVQVFRRDHDDADADFPAMIAWYCVFSTIVELVQQVIVLMCLTDECLKGANRLSVRARSRSILSLTLGTLGTHFHLRKTQTSFNARSETWIRNGNADGGGKANFLFEPVAILIYPVHGVSAVRIRSGELLTTLTGGVLKRLESGMQRCETSDRRVSKGGKISNNPTHFFASIVSRR